MGHIPKNIKFKWRITTLNNKACEIKGIKNSNKTLFVFFEISSKTEKKTNMSDFSIIN